MEFINLPIENQDQLDILQKHHFENIIFCCDSTKILSQIKNSEPELYQEIMNQKNLIQITGGAYGAFYRFLRNNPQFNIEDNKNSITYLQKYGKTIYQVDDVKKILDIYEKIEHGIDKDWSDIQKVMYIYSKLQEYITSYNTKGGNHRSNFDGTINSNNDSLLALVDETGMCDSISTVFHEAMQRIGIESRWIESKGHAWNIVTTRDEIDLKKKNSFAIDLTWDVCFYEKYGKKSFHNFGFSPKFDNASIHHIPANVDDLVLFKQCKELPAEYKKNIFESVKSPAINKIE